VTGAGYKMTQVTIGNAECPTLVFLKVGISTAASGLGFLAES
jgi:hypothetical protein